jgi:hypothetical protein
MMFFFCLRFVVLEAFVYLACHFLRVNLLFLAERRMSSLTFFFCSYDVVDLEGVVLFGVVHFVGFLYFFKT